MCSAGEGLIQMLCTSNIAQKVVLLCCEDNYRILGNVRHMCKQLLDRTNVIYTLHYMALFFRPYSTHRTKF